MNLQPATGNHTHYFSTLPADSTLLQACRAGNKQAWLKLLNKYESLIYSIPLNYHLSNEDSTDITQIVFTALLQSLGTLSDDSNLSHWLTLVARRYTWRTLQFRQIEAGNELDKESIRGLFPNQPSEVDRCKVLEWLNAGLVQMDEHCRSLLQAFYFKPNNPSVAEVAQQLGIPADTFSPTHAECLQRLQQFLTPSIKIDDPELTFMQLLGWAEESLPLAEIDKTAQRVANANQKLREQVQWLQSFIWLSKQIMMVQPPREAHITLVRRFAILMKTEHDSFFFDDFWRHPSFLTSTLRFYQFCPSYQNQYINLLLPSASLPWH